MQMPLRSARDSSTGAHTAPERFELLHVLGEGTYGVVYQANDRVTDKVVALKKMRLDSRSAEEGVPQTALREISILQELHHPHIVNLMHVQCTSTKLWLAFEYLDQDLKKALDKRGSPYSGRALKSLMLQLLDGLYFCHRHRIVHRDLKPANILLSADGVLKIADFGLARAFQVPLHTLTHEVVTLWYRAPEILLGEKHYTPAVDMWSVGCIMAELARGKVLFRGDTEIGQLYEVFQVLGTPTEAQWPGVSRLPDFCDAFPRWAPSDIRALLPLIDADGIDLLLRMLRYDPAERISAKDAMNHPWFADMRL
jgi:cyclin-dependent kinase 3